MRSGKITNIALTALMIASVTAAIPTTTYAAASQPAASQSASTKIKYGKVTAVTSSKLTLSLGTVEMPEPPAGAQGGNGMQAAGNTPAGAFGGMQGTPPDGMNGGGQTPPDGFGGGNTAQPPRMPSGEAAFTPSGKKLTVDLSGVSITKMGQTASLSDISTGDILTLVYTGSKLSEIKIGADSFGGQGVDAPGAGGAFGAAGGAPGAAGGQGKPGGQDAKSDVTAKYTADSTSKSITSKKISSSAADTSVILATNGGRYTVKNSSLTKSGSTSSEDGSNFYGLNAAAVAQSGSSIAVTGSRITTDADGANAVFAAGEGAKVTVKDTTITTKQDSSRGLDATLGGTINASDVKISTSGAHCAALATDRGGGTVTASDSVLNTAGEGSPCIYSTGDIKAVSCTGKASGAQIAVVEGKNSVTLEKCSLTGAGSDGVMLYQSTSGDADVGTATFTAKSSTLKSTSSGPMFYVTNTDAVIDLTSVKLSYKSGVLLRASGNDGARNWGKVGANGGNVVLKAKKQTLKGDITCGSISTVDVSLTGSSKLTGTIDGDNTGDVSVSLDSTSVWNVTGDSYVTSVTSAKSDFSNIKSNGHTVYYDSSKCTALGGKTYALPGGGSLTPAK